ncbi:hypothetical protein ANCCAN_20222 [Ancylostoma caninum]|uniref:G-protein coupled receptors family 1 profile domain-containing protein n=1 Tax=Ancylostoma caninum TaxID=29170 RepID=A0A368FP76_ANCCA|nr:hypothetical protein ANCCAN_20222 [Ancylostoma caninum]
MESVDISTAYLDICPALCFYHNNHCQRVEEYRTTEDFEFTCHISGVSHLFFAKQFVNVSTATVILIIQCSYIVNLEQRMWRIKGVLKGIADVAVVVNYTLFITLRTTGLFSDVFWNLQDYYIATWCFAQYYFTVVLRALGILLITVHRYITICKDGSPIEHWANSEHRWILIAIHWIFPTLYILPFLCRDAVPFDNPTDLDPAPKQKLISLANLLAVAFVVPSFTTCIMCYSAILRFLYKHRVDLNGSLRRERLVCMQMMGIFVAFALLMIYHILQFNFSLQSNVSRISFDNPCNSFQQLLETSNF